MRLPHPLRLAREARWASAVSSLLLRERSDHDSRGEHLGSAHMNLDRKLTARVVKAKEYVSQTTLEH